MRLILLLSVCFSVQWLSAQTVTRGPYLQSGAPTSMVVRWRTDSAVVGRVRYGNSPTNLSSFVDESGAKGEHEVKVSGLLPNTTYYYSIGTPTATLAGSPSHFFLTAPPAGQPKNTRIWVLGDAGSKNADQVAVKNAYYALATKENRHTDLWLMLGDNAYENGTDAEYQSAVFNMYPETLRKSSLFSTRGNHERTVDANNIPIYYHLFTLPANGEAGGLPSNTEAYYSFDHGNIHFICLDSQGTVRTSTGAMAQWLKNDLANTTADWIIAFWHHPPYTKGSHNSDTEVQLKEMREAFLPILEQGGVDLVLSGHSHSYERSYLLNGHYGLSSTLTPSMILDNGSGRMDGTGAYSKPVDTPHAGAVYAVPGSSGKLGGGTLNHPVMYKSLNLLGSMVIDVEGNKLHARFLRQTGAIEDYFTIEKSVGAVIAPQPPTDLKAVGGDQKITLTWLDKSTDESSFEIERSLDGVTFEPVTQRTANAVSFVDSGLAVSTTYHYRVRAKNAAGVSAFTAVASATTSSVGNVPTPKTLTFAPVADTYVRQASAGSAFGSSSSIVIDGDEPGGSGKDAQGLLKFNIIGTTSGLIPPGSTIQSADLTLQTTNPGDGASLHRMKMAWSETSTWNSLVSGVQANGTEAETNADLRTGAVSTGSRSFNVLSSAQAWSRGAANHGWVLFPSGNNGWDFYSRQGATAPKLTVTFTPPATP